MAASHWIGSVSFELRSNDQRALDPVRRLIREEHDRVLLGPLGRALDRVDRPGKVARFRRIELDLGTIGPGGGLGEILERRISEWLHAGLPWEGGPADRAAPARQAAELLHGFLETGLLAWSSPRQVLEAISLALGPGAGGLERITPELRRLLARSPSSALRLARQCPLGLVIAIARSLAGRDPGRLRPGGSMNRHAGERDAGRLARLVLVLSRGESIPDDDWRWLDEMAGGVLLASTTRVAGTRPSAPRAPRATSDAFMAGPPAERADPRSAIPDGAAEDAGADAGYPLDAAGLVLIHPFVPELMRACGLLDEKGSFKGDEERERGLLLLYLAATGKSEAAEPDLLLAKLLLGQDPSVGCPRTIEPSPHELHEVDGMLEAAIGHWGALGETSPAALRESFLARPGRLSRAGEEWRLQVEPSGIDVLLDRLPWAIGFVLTQFMARPLRVEWR